MRLLCVFVVAAISVTSCSGSDDHSAQQQSSVEDIQQFERSLSANDCHTPSQVDRGLLQQSWQSDRSPDSWLAFGDNGFNDYGAKMTASYCLEGNTIVGRQYTETMQISVAGHAVRPLSRTAVNAPLLKWQIVELTRHDLVLKDVGAGTQAVWHRSN